MCAKFRALTVEEQSQLVRSPSEIEESYNDAGGLSATISENCDKSSMNEIRKEIQQNSKQFQIRKSSKRSSVKSASTAITFSSSSDGSGRSDENENQPRMSKMPGKRPRTRSNAGLSEPQRLALIQGIDASHPMPPLPATYKKSSFDGKEKDDEVEEMENPLELTRTRTIGRGWTMCSVLPDAHSIDEDTDLEYGSDDECPSSADSNSRAVTRTNTLLERVLSNIIHDRPEQLFQDLQAQQSPTSIESDPIEQMNENTQSTESKMQKKVTRLDTFGSSNIQPNEWGSFILDVRMVDKENGSYETRTMERSVEGTTYEAGGTENGDDLEIPHGCESVSRDSVMRAISTASHHHSIEWENVQAITKRITCEEENKEDLKARRESSQSTISSNSQSESQCTESSATIDIVDRFKPRQRHVPLRSTTTIIEVDSDEARDFLRGGQETEMQMGEEVLTPDKITASPSAVSSTASSTSSSSSSSSSSEEGQREEENVQRRSLSNRSDAKQEYTNARQALQRNTILLDRAVEAKPAPQSAAVQTSPLQMQMQRHTYYRPLRQAVQRSSCSKFWSPSSRTSLRVRSQQIPRVVLVPEIKVSEEGQDEQDAKEECNLDEEEENQDDDSDSSKESSESEAETVKQPTPPLTPDDKIVRFYSKPNYRATIYPRQVDEFFGDKTLHQAIQERLMEIFLGRSFGEQRLNVPLSNAKRVSRISAKFSRRFSKKHLSVSMLMPPPQRPLPAVPVDVSIPNSPCTCDDEVCSNCSGCRFDSYDVANPTSRDDRNARLSIVSATSLTKKTRRRKTYVMGRHPLHNSWITETESMTSYCSWVSIISGDHSISSSSSCPASPRKARCGAETCSHQLQSKNKSHFTITDRKQKEGLLIVSDPLNSATHPPSSTILPANWNETQSQNKNVSKEQESNLPKVQDLSPFFLDPHRFWPDDEDATPALEKWKRYKEEQEKTPKAKEDELFSQKAGKRMTMNIHRLSLASSSSDTVRMEGSLDSLSSSGSSTVMTPPRAEFLQSGLESPGKRISQILSPYHDDAMTPKVQVASTIQDRITTIPRLRSIDAPAPTVLAPKHKRWIIIDGNGKRITGGNIRDSTSTWHSASHDDAGNETADSSFSTFSSTISSESDSDSVELKCKNDELDTNRQTFKVSTGIPLTQSPGPIRQDMRQPLTVRNPDPVIVSSTRRSVLFSPTSGRPITLEPEQVRSILMKRRSTTHPSARNVNVNTQKVTSQRTTSESFSDRGTSIRFAEKRMMNKMSAIPEKSTNVSSTTEDFLRQKQNLFAPPLPPAIPLPALPQARIDIRAPLRDDNFQFTQSPTDISSISNKPEPKIQVPSHPPQRSQSLPMVPRPEPKRQDTNYSTKSVSSKSRLTRADLSERIQREEVRIKRNDERLTALDKLEGKKQKMHLLANLIKSTTNGVTPDSMQTNAGHSNELTNAIEKAKKEETKRGEQRIDSQHFQTIVEDVEGEEREVRGEEEEVEEVEIPTTPLTPFREQLRKMEREWEIRHHVKEYAPLEAQKFTNVIGFDIGIVPFRGDGGGGGGVKSESNEHVKNGGIRIKKRGKQGKGRRSRDPNGFPIDIKQFPPPYSDEFSAMPTIQINPPSESFITDKTLERDLHAGLRKLSSVVEARQRAKERCVDK